MENENLANALGDLVQAIEAIMLGSIQANVIEEAGKALINSWNDHNDEKINTVDELYNWEHRHSNEQVSIRVACSQGHCHCGGGCCPCGEDH